MLNSSERQHRGVSAQVHVARIDFKGESPMQFEISFEIFPPKTPSGEEQLRAVLRELATWNPAFISCTYGAGGSTSKQTLQWCEFIQEELGIPAMAHFTCIGQSKQDLLNWLEDCVERNIRRVLALRGDAPQAATSSNGHEEFRYAYQLVELIRRHFPELSIAVAGYPETHPETQDDARGDEHLLQKIAAGATTVYTQLFFENTCFFRFQDRIRQTDSLLRIIPGIMPLTDYTRIARIASLCRSAIPPELKAQLKHAQNDPQEQFRIGINHALQQCQHLKANGAQGIHFYTLNSTKACGQILSTMGSLTAL